MRLKTFISVLFFLNSIFSFAAPALFIKSWQLGGDLTVRFQSDVFFDYTEKDALQIAAHLPGLGLSFKKSTALPTLILEHKFNQINTTKIFQQQRYKTRIESNWSKTLPADFIHLLYGVARVEWIKRGIFPVHAACIGNDKDGFTLLIGAPGAGKTSLTLQALSKNFKVYSGDKTLLRFLGNSLEAVSGTRTITIRQHDEKRWQYIDKIQEQSFGDRIAFQLKRENYSQNQHVKITKIVLVGLNNSLDIFEKLDELTALHALYPFFMDKQREDILIEGGQAIFDGSISRHIRLRLAKELKSALRDIPVYRAIGSLEKVTDAIVASAPSKPKNILVGVAGIGNGHSIRQAPIIRHLLDLGHRVMVFTYGEGLAFFHERFLNEPRLSIVPVMDPYFVGSPSGLDFETTANIQKNKINFHQINSIAMHRAARDFGRPDLVISDYELIAAQYAYAKDAPLITFDQQSKYLVGDFPQFLNGTSFIDEVERLNLFFPKAEKRIAVSFFRVEKNHHTKINVDILPPAIRPEVLSAGNGNLPRSKVPSLLVYLTAQQALGDKQQTIDERIEIIQAAIPEGFEAHVFLPRDSSLKSNHDRLFYYHHGDTRFDSLLFSAHGIITTAGHNLLSEAMFLQIPVLALPLPLYEQQLNAEIIAKGNFGINQQFLSKENIHIFLTNLESYRKNIKDDQKLLMKQHGNDLVIEKITKILDSKY